MPGEEEELNNLVTRLARDRERQVQRQRTIHEQRIEEFRIRERERSVEEQNLFRRGRVAEVERPRTFGESFQLESTIEPESRTFRLVTDTPNFVGEGTTATTTWTTNDNTIDTSAWSETINSIFAIPKKKVTKKTIDKIIETVENDGEIMDIKKLSVIEKKTAICTDLNKYYLLNCVQPISTFRPTNSFISYGIKTRIQSGKIKQCYNRAIVLGYIYKGKVYTAKELESVWTSSSYSDNLEILCYVVESDNGGKVNYIDRVSWGNHSKYTSAENILNILSNFKIKIKAGELSGRVWGLQVAKSKLAGTSFKNYSIEYGKFKSIDTSYYILLDPNDRLGLPEEEKTTESKKLKFTLSDVEFILPTLRGYMLPKDKTIKIGSTVKVLDKKVTKQVQENIYTVQNIKVNNRSKKMGKNQHNYKLDVVMCASPQGNVIRVYAKNLKLIK